MKKNLIVFLAILLAFSSYPVPVLSTGTVDMYFYEMDLREALRELSLQAEVNIIVSDAVRGTVTYEQEEGTVEDALGALLSGTPYQWVERDGLYLVGHQEEAMFAELAQTRSFQVRYAPVAELAAEIAEYPVELSFNEIRGVIMVTAIPMVLQEIASLIEERDSPDEYRQVGYALEVIELTDERASALGLREASLELPTPTEALLTVISRPDILSVVASLGVSTLRFEAADEDTRAGRVSTPEIATAVGSTAVLRVVQEETKVLEGADRLIEDTTGLEISLTPRHVNPQTREVSSRIEITSPGKAQVDTDLWLSPDEHTLVAVVEQTMDTQTSRALFRRTGQEKRYFAVYASARPLTAAPDERPIVPTGTLGRLDQLFWPLLDPEPILEENYAAAAISPGETWQGRLEAGAWVTDRIRTEASMTTGTEETWLWFGAEGRIFREDTRVGARVHYGTEEGMRVSAGISDRVHMGSGVSVSAGVHPLVYNLSERELDSPYWWAEAEVKQDRLSARGRVSRQSEDTRWEVGVGVDINEHATATISYTDTFDSGNGRLLIGVRVRF